MLNKNEQYLNSYEYCIAKAEILGPIGEISTLWRDIADSYRLLLECEKRHPTREFDDTAKEAV